MKAVLTKSSAKLYHVVGGVEVDGPHSGLWGDCSDLRGDCSGLCGNLGACEITAEDRAKGVNIADLVATTT